MIFVVKICVYLPMNNPFTEILRVLFIEDKSSNRSKIALSSSDALNENSMEIFLNNVFMSV